MVKVRYLPQRCLHESDSYPESLYSLGSCSSLAWADDTAAHLCGDPRSEVQQADIQPPQSSGVATGVRGCGPHRAALARGGKGAKNAENLRKNSRENSDCEFHVFACKKNKALRPACTYRQLLGYVGSLAASGSNFDFVGVSVTPISCCSRSVHTEY